ncbi:MAG: hypothetical protein J5877_06630 [Clostridia bacterium]|nr:hypothetical protein [Clostridia bacterium]
MKESIIDIKIKELENGIVERKNERYIRDGAQVVYLCIITDASLGKAEKDEKLNRLRKTLRSLPEPARGEGCDFCEINSLLRELCLAASFYLLEKEKLIRLLEAESEIFVKINKRSFENRFFDIVSRLMIKNDEATVELRCVSRYCSIVISAKNVDGSLSEKPPKNVFSVYEYNTLSLALNMKREKQIPEKITSEDFSLLLSDAFSPLNIWFCDI